MEILVGIFLLFIVGLYFLPWFIAGNKPQSASVFVVNLFFGWTFIGWVIALAMAVAPKKEKYEINHEVGSIVTEQVMANTKQCPFCAEVIKRDAIICRFCNRELNQNIEIPDDAPAEKKEDRAGEKLVTGWELTSLATNSIFWTFGLAFILVISGIGIIGWTMSNTANKESENKPAQDIATSNNISKPEQQAILPATVSSDDRPPPETIQDQPQDTVALAESSPVLATVQEPIVLEGKGNQVTRSFYLGSGLATINYSVSHNHDAEYSDPTAFAINLKGTDGEDIDLVANEIGDNINESQAVTVPAAGTYVINVNAVGNWKIEVSQ